MPANHETSSGSSVAALMSRRRPSTRCLRPTILPGVGPCNLVRSASHPNPAPPSTATRRLVGRHDATAYHTAPARPPSDKDIQKLRYFVDIRPRGSPLPVPATGRECPSASRSSEPYISSVCLSLQFAISFRPPPSSLLLYNYPTACKPAHQGWVLVSFTYTSNT